MSRRVVEEAAKLQGKVLQIVASRRQCDGTVGYIGMNQLELVELVKKLSHNQCAVVRDHGGPLQGWGKSWNPLEYEDAVEESMRSFDADMAAGFQGLHLDVSKLPRYKQPLALRDLFIRYHGQTLLEVGGEHDPWEWNLYLMMQQPQRPDWIVLNTGTFVWADRQRGHLEPLGKLREANRLVHGMGMRVKAHNWDWLYRGEVKQETEICDAYNLAPEIAAVEIDALLMCFSSVEVNEVLNLAYESNLWKFWFKEGEGTFLERARCAMRYVLEHPKVKNIYLTEQEEILIRSRIRDALLCG